LINVCLEEGAIYLPDNSWNLYDFVGAFGINPPKEYMENWWAHERYWGNFREYILDEINLDITNAGRLGGRFAYIPMVEPILYTMAAADYGVMWMNGEVPKKGVNIEALRECMEVYTSPGIDIEVYTGNGTIFDNYLQVTQPFLTFQMTDTATIDNAAIWSILTAITIN